MNEQEAGRRRGAEVARQVHPTAIPLYLPPLSVYTVNRFLYWFGFTFAAH